MFVLSSKREAFAMQHIHILFLKKNDHVKNEFTSRAGHRVFYNAKGEEAGKLYRMSSERIPSHIICSPALFGHHNRTCCAPSMTSTIESPAGTDTVVLLVAPLHPPWADTSTVVAEGAKIYTLVRT